MGHSPLPNLTPAGERYTRSCTYAPQLLAFGTALMLSALVLGALVA